MKLIAWKAWSTNEPMRSRNYATFMGRWLRTFFAFTMAGDLYGIFWTFAAVFGSSLSEHLPMGTDYDYQIYVFLFMAVTFPTSCTRLHCKCHSKYSSWWLGGSCCTSVGKALCGVCFWRFWFRLAASVPQAIGSLFLKDLGVM